MPTEDPVECRGGGGYCTDGREGMAGVVTEPCGTCGPITVTVKDPPVDIPVPGLLEEILKMREEMKDFHGPYVIHADEESIRQFEEKYVITVVNDGPKYDEMTKDEFRKELAGWNITGAITGLFTAQPSMTTISMNHVIPLKLDGREIGTVDVRTGECKIETEWKRGLGL